ncbi:ABC transporter ATP-binding protein [Paenibacillus sp. MMS18-CY102]|uniref:ABC transporter ATP-binding protein n=1 Tax=Paenibacillus sp. MMS18-CY102 TaxID=2682849 RepID=UPI001366730B|nr:ABC transporter ATP-binding protein [Paenibacillus sp. MMS18-CY102]MWC26911.1 ATP-binding cassette domain-containing protein [Paenibacillus sp. MMS18-CY102]
MNYWQFIRTNLLIVKGTYALVLLFLVLESVSNYSLVYVQKILIDDVFGNGHYSLLTTVITVFGVAGLVHALMFTMTSRYLVKNEFAISHSLLRRMLGRIEHVPIERFGRDRNGKYVYTMTQDLFQTASFLGWQLPRGGQEILNFIILVGIIGFANPMMLLMMLVMCGFYLAAGYYFSPKLHEAAKKVSERRTALLIQIEEGVASTREVIAFHRLKWEEKLYNKLFDRYYEQFLEEGKLVNRQMRWSDPMKWGIGLIVLGYGGYELMHGRISIGMFVIVFQFATQMSDSCYNVFQFFMGFSSQMAYMDRVNGILTLEQNVPGVRKLNESPKEIAFEDVRFRYAEELPDVIQSLSAGLPAGRKLAFVGSSGGGKSTIAQLLIRFYDPAEGTIRLNGVPIHELDRQQWTDGLSIVFQDPYMFPDTIRENLLLGRDGVTQEKLEEACRIAQIDSFIEQLPDGYDTQVGERGIKLSGGQRQRLAIARAILGNPSILVLDEATSALDLETERRLLAALDESRQGLSMIMIAHRLSTIENADQIYVLDRGRLADSGTHEELLAKPGGVYSELLMAQR